MLKLTFPHLQVSEFFKKSVRSQWKVSEIQTGYLVDTMICHKQFLDIDNFKVLKKCQTTFELVIHEALSIKRLRPKLNKQLMKGGASYLLKVF